MVERFNQTSKNMLSRVVREHKRQWHKVVPLMVWALREVPNATTSVSPYLLVYGRVARGPLAVLKESWIGERDIAFHLGKPVEQYLSDLKAKLESAVNFAEKRSQQAQNSYATHYNRRAKEKHFVKGEQVIVLAPENRGKLSNLGKYVKHKTLSFLF